MIDQSPEPRRDRLPRAVLGALALIASIEVFLACHHLSFATPMILDWERTGQIARRHVADFEILCFGDSFMKFGVQPILLEKQIGRRAYNLAVYSGTAPASYYLLRRSLRSGTRPALVLVDFDWLILAEGPRSTARPFPWAHFLDIREALDLARSSRSPDLLARVLLAKAFPSIRDREGIRSRLLGIAQGKNPRWDRLNLATHVRNWTLNLGAELAARNPGNRDIPPGPGTRDPFAGWRPDPVNLEYVDRFLDLAARAKVPVCWLLPPATPGYQAFCDRSLGRAAFLRLLDEYRANHHGLTFVDALHSGYNYSLFFDTVHLDRKGAIGLSTELATIAGRLIQGHPLPRVVDVPPFRDRQARVMLEDNEGSMRFAIRSYYEGRRRR